MRKLIQQTDVSFIFFICLRAGVVEEILWRGYALERLEALTGNRWIAGLVSLASFTYVHLSAWGTVHLITLACLGGLLTLFYFWKRDLWANIIPHFLFDFLSLMSAKFAPR